MLMQAEHATLHLRLRLDEAVDHLSNAIVADERFVRWCDRSSIRFVQRDYLLEITRVQVPFKQTWPIFEFAR